MASYALDSLKSLDYQEDTEWEAKTFPFLFQTSMKLHLVQLRCFH